MNILVCYDGSNVSKEALKLARKYAKIFNAKVYVVTSMKGGADVPRKEFERAEKELKEAKGYVREEDIACVTKLSVRGIEPGEDIVRYAKENNIDQIIVGVRRRSKVGKLVFGSTAQYVILEANCPVVSVK